MPAPEIYNFDLETSSPVNLNTDGSDAYTRDPRTRALMASYHPVSQPDRPRLWLEGDPVPQEIIDTSPLAASSLDGMSPDSIVWYGNANWLCTGAGPRCRMTPGSIPCTGPQPPTCRARLMAVPNFWVSISRKT